MIDEKFQLSAYKTQKKKSNQNQKDNIQVKIFNKMHDLSVN